MANVKVTGAARLYRAASVWTAGLGLFAAVLATTFVEISLCRVGFKLSWVGISETPQATERFQGCAA